MFKIIKCGFLAAAAFVALAGAASAATCNGASANHSFTINEATSCYSFGGGNINGNNMDAILASDLDLILLDKSDQSGDPLNVLSGNVGPNGSNTGTFTIASFTGYTNLIVALKAGNNMPVSWAAFNISGPGTFNFSILPKQGGGISHVNLYGKVAVCDGDCDGGTGGEVPLPAGLPLILTALGVTGLVARKRKAA